jgi:hypothetical protein
MDGYNFANKAKQSAQNKRLNGVSPSKEILASGAAKP